MPGLGVRQGVRLEGGDVFVQCVDRAKDGERRQEDEGLGAAQVVERLEPVEPAEALRAHIENQLQVERKGGGEAAAATHLARRTAREERDLARLGRLRLLAKVRRLVHVRDALVDADGRAEEVALQALDGGAVLLDGDPGAEEGAALLEAEIEQPAACAQGSESALSARAQRLSETRGGQRT